VALDDATLATLSAALLRVDAQIANVGREGEHIATQLRQLASRMQDAFAALATAPTDDVEAAALRAELQAAAHVMTALATRCLLDLARARQVLTAGVEPLVTRHESERTTHHA
jgi:hypothetical protein